MRMPEGISDTDFLLLEVLWQKGKKQFFIVRNADMNLRNGWGSARHAGSGIHLWKRQLKKRPESR